MKKLLIVFFLCSLITSVFAEPPVDTANFVILNQTAQKSCFSSTIQFLNKSNSFSYHTYVWDFGDGSKKDTVSFKTDSITQGKKNHTYTKDGQFTVVLTILDTTAGKKVVLAQKRRANFILVYRPSSQDFTYKINDFETFDYTFKIPEDFKPFDKTVWQYEWDFGDNGSTELTDSTAIFHHFTEENKIKGYNVKLKIKLNVDKVTLTTKKTEECFDTIVVNVKVKDGFFKNDSLKSTPLVPNIFTPNKDGVNE